MISRGLESSISWLDFSEDDRRKMMEVVSLFKLRETRDELGLGSIRNVFAELLLTGTGTLRTRARYFLSVPWNYMQFEKNRVPSSRLWERLLQEEIRLIRILIAQDDTEGVIGRIYGASLTRFPSSIYWFELRGWGIFQRDISQSHYHRTLDCTYILPANRQGTDDGEPLDWGLEHKWNPHLLDPLKSFPGGTAPLGAATSHRALFPIALNHVSTERSPTATDRIEVVRHGADQDLMMFTAIV